MEIQPLNGQSNYDLCIQAYGGFDNFIKLLTDNNLSASTSINNGKYSVDSTLNNINSNNIGVIYATKNQNQISRFHDSFHDSSFD